MSRPRLLYVVTEDWYFLSHRLPMAIAAQKAGFEVHVATRVVDAGDEIRTRGFVLHHVPFARGDVSPFATLRAISRLRDVLRTVQPIISHHVALQPAVFASLAALDQDIVCVNAVTGFGSVFAAQSGKARFVRPILRGLLRIVLGHKRNIVLVQNPDDRANVIELGVPHDRIATIAGSGVDLARFAVVPEPAGPITFGFAGRLLADKGVQTLVEAHAILRARGRDHVLRIAGRVDPANPTSIPQSVVDRWKQLPGVELHGHIDRVEAFWKSCHIAVLPSRREGLPKSLLEAAACGRPLVGTDVPGCREVVLPGRTGLLVPVDNPQALADALEMLASSRELRAQYGSAARALAESTFGEELVATSIAALYESLSHSTKERRDAR